MTEDFEENMYDEFGDFDGTDLADNVEEFVDVESYEAVEDFSEVLELTEYQSNETAPSHYVQADYNNIDVVETSKEHRTKAKSLVNQITKFIIDFNDIELTDDHKRYIRNVANLQFEQLHDMLFMMSANRQLLENMLLRINSVMAEDYAMIQTYNTILNQQLKLHKELNNTYRNIPTVMRKMRLDIIENPENAKLGNGSDIGDTVSETFGERHFNNGKQLLKKIADAKMKKLNQLKEDNITKNSEN